MQFRPVLNDHAVGCGNASGQNPDPSATVSLPGPQPGTCLGLGPSTLTISRAQTTATQGQSGQVEVDFTLGSGDAARFDHLAQANYQRQVAVVMFGQILEAPTINAQSFGGQGQITGLTVDQAARAAAALSGR
jgi:preprotein translocase subunit SecD